MNAVEACKKAEKERPGIETCSKEKTANTVTPAGTNTSEEKEIAKDHFAYMISRRCDTKTKRCSISSWTHVVKD